MSLGKWLLKTFDNTNVDDLLEKVRQLENQVASLNDSLRKHVESEGRLSMQNKEMSDELSRQKSLLKGQDVTLKEREELISKLEKTVSELHNTIEVSHSKETELEQELTIEKSSLSKSESERDMMQKQLINCKANIDRLENIAVR